jgi:hypothetical protein
MNLADKSKLFGEWKNDIFVKGSITLKNSTIIKGNFTSQDF